MLDKLLDNPNLKFSNRRYTADFETSTAKWLEKDNETRVWAFAICEINEPSNIIIGNNIEDFMDWCKSQKFNPILYFHNMKFDGEYIIHYLLSNGYEVIKDKKDRKNKTFTCLISGTNQFYSIEVYFEVGKKVRKVTFIDSLKILNFSVEKIAKDFKLPISKLSIDYDEYREVGHELTQEEKDYIKNDVEIMARALKIMFDCDLTKMTIGSDALGDYKKLNKNFNKYFPVLPNEKDYDIRLSYRGGFTYLNPLYKEKETGSGVVLDVNSLYPSVMYNENLPYGEPIYFKGKYKKDRLYPLYVQSINVMFDIKKDKIPTIQLKKTPNFMGSPTEYVTSSNGDIVTIMLTSVDLELFFEQYDIHYISYNDGYKFKQIKGLFNEYIDKWTSVKIESKKEDNKALYKIAKLMLNSLYGKFGLNPNIRTKYPYLQEDGSVKYGFYPMETRDSVYIPMASFITAYARKKTITTSQSIRDYTKKKYGKDLYIYSDTDSIHTNLTNENELKSFVDIDDYKLGAWKLESTFTRGAYIRAKSYIEEGEDGTLNTTIAGLPKSLGSSVNFKNFKVGTSFYGKLVPKHTKGGVVLVEDYFTIREK